MAILLNRSASVVFVPYITLTSKCWERGALKADVFCSAMCCSVLPCPQGLWHSWLGAVLGPSECWMFNSCPPSSPMETWDQPASAQVPENGPEEKRRSCYWLQKQLKLINTHCCESCSSEVVCSFCTHVILSLSTPHPPTIFH